MNLNPNAIKRILTMPTSNASCDGTMPPTRVTPRDGIDRKIGMSKRRAGQKNATTGPRNGRRVCSRVDETGGRVVYRVAM